MSETVSAIVVSFSGPAAGRRAVDSLLAQSDPPIEVLVADNDPRSRTVEAMKKESDPRVRIVHHGENLGYTLASNRAAAAARGDWLFFLNPDARAEPKCLETMRGFATPSAGVLGAQVLLPDGRTNAGDNPLHITGIAWAGRYGEPAERGPARSVAAVSGAALMVRAELFSKLGGLCERFFLYQDDIDLCWRVRLAGWEVLYCPDATVVHDYEFDKGKHKWYWLERNRLWSVLSNYSGVTLSLLAPVLLLAELPVALLALRGRWAGRLIRAWGSTLLAVPELVRWRRRVQATRRVPDSQILRLMTGRFETSLLKDSLPSMLNSALDLLRLGLIGILSVFRR